MTIEEREGLPAGWVEASIGDLIELNPKNYLPDTAEIGFIPMSSLGTDFLSAPKFEPKLWAETKKGYTHFASGDVLLAKITPCFENGKSGIPENLPNDAGAGSTEYFVCRTHESALKPRYLLGYFQTEQFLKVGALNMSGSVGHKRVPKEYVTETVIPLPPLAEQIRIADKLDTLLSRVDAGRERLERVPKLVKRFRQSVLSAAVSGELTREWRGGGDAEWEEISTINLCLSNRALTYGVIKLGEEIKDGVPCLRTSNVRRLRYDLEGIKKISSELSISYSRTILEGNEVLVNVRGSLDGVAVVPASFRGWNVSREVAVIPYDNSIILSNYAAMYIASEIAQAWLRDSYRGVAYTGINIEDLKNLPVPLPSLPEQAEIVRRVEALFALADRLEARAQAALARYSRLTPALLAKAFRGELVPQDPADEPASVLLERIKAQREAAGPVKKAVGRGRKPGATTPRAEAGAQAGEAQSELRRGRGRPRKVVAEATEAGAGHIPLASSQEDAIRLLQERARAEREGKQAVQAGLFGGE